MKNTENFYFKKLHEFINTTNGFPERTGRFSEQFSVFSVLEQKEKSHGIFQNNVENDRFDILTALIKILKWSIKFSDRLQSYDLIVYFFKLTFF